MGGKGLEAIGRATDIQQVADYGTGVVEQQDKDIAKGGYTPKYNKSLRDTFNEDGVESAVGWLGEKTAENSVSGGVALGGGLSYSRSGNGVCACGRSSRSRNYGGKWNDGRRRGRF